MLVFLYFTCTFCLSDLQRPVKKQKKSPEAPKKGMTDEEVIASILEKPEAECQESLRDEGAGGDDDSEGDAGQSQATDVDQPIQSTSEGPSQGGEGDVLSQVIESVIKDWAPGQGPPRTSQEAEAGDGSKLDIFLHFSSLLGPCSLKS
jgi:hypothetical protein